MKRIIIPLFLFLATFGLQAQTTTYFKKSKLRTKVPEDKARFKVIRLLRGDTLITDFCQIKGNIILAEVKMINGMNAEGWNNFIEVGKLISKKRVGTIVYSKRAVGDMYINGFNSNCKSCKPARFPGGNEKLMQFLDSHVHYPEGSKQLHHSGTVYIRFIIKKDGTAVPFSIVKGVDPFIDSEAWHIVKEMPKWTPATRRGKPIQSLFRFPFRFSSM